VLPPLSGPRLCGIGTRMGAKDRATLRLSILYGAFFLFVGVYTPYWPVWLESLEFTPLQISLLFGLGPWTRALANPVAGWLAHRRIARHRLLTGLAVASLLGYGCFFATREFAVVFVLMLLIGFLDTPMLPLLDSIALTSRVDFGRVRLWGSVTFIAASLLGGWLLEDRSESLVLVLVLSSSLIVALASLLAPRTDIPPSSATPSASTEDNQVPSRPILYQLRRPNFPLFLLTCGFLQASHAMLYVFGTLHWRTIGIDESTIGMLWAEAVVFEVILFWVAGRLKNIFRPAHWLVIAAAGGVLRWTVLAGATSLAPLVATQALHALTFAAMYFGAMEYIRAHTPDRDIAIATTLYSALASGVAFGLVIPASGLVYEKFGGATYFAMAALSAFGLVAALVLLRRTRARGSTLLESARAQ